MTLVLMIFLLKKIESLCCFLSSCLVKIIHVRLSASFSPSLSLMDVALQFLKWQMFWLYAISIFQSIHFFRLKSTLNVDGCNHSRYVSNISTRFEALSYKQPNKTIEFIEQFINKHNEYWVCSEIYGRRFYYFGLFIWCWWLLCVPSEPNNQQTVADISYHLNKQISFRCI